MSTSILSTGTPSGKDPCRPCVLESQEIVVASETLSGWPLWILGSHIESVSRYLEWAGRGWCSEGPQEEGKLSSPLGMGTEEGEARADGLPQSWG